MSNFWKHTNLSTKGKLLKDCLPAVETETLQI